MSVFDDWRYPCSNCPNKKCLVGCMLWNDWVRSVWGEVCKPFRDARDERDERRMMYGR